MPEIDKQVRRVVRRLNGMTFVHALTWAWFGGLCLATLGVVADRVWHVGGSVRLAVAVGLGAGLMVALGVTWLRRTCPVAAAIELDRAFDLQERVSSAVSLPAYLHDRPAARALVRDAHESCRRLHVPDRFPVRSPRSAILPVLAAVALTAVGILMPRIQWPDPRPGSPDDPDQHVAVSNNVRVLKKRIAARRRRARQVGLNRADKLLDQIEDVTQEIMHDQKTKRRDAQVKLSQLANQLRDEQAKLGGSRDIQRSLARLQDQVSSGPADDLVKALAQGDYKKAAQALQRIQQALANKELPEAKRKALRKQMGELAKALDQLAQQKKAQAQKSRQPKPSGKPGGALPDGLQKLADAMGNVRGLEKLGQQLRQCRDCMQRNDPAGAEQAARGAMEQLQQMLQDARELEMLDAALADLKECKGCMGQGDCMGAGMDDPFENEQRRVGRGMGRGRGRGERPERAHETRDYDTGVRQQVGRGAASIVDLVDGSQVKGQARARFVRTVQAAEKEATDALERQRIPPDYQKHIKRYFMDLQAEATPDE